MQYVTVRKVLDKAVLELAAVTRNVSSCHMEALSSADDEVPAVDDHTTNCTSETGHRHTFTAIALSLPLVIGKICLSNLNHVLHLVLH